MPSASAKLEKQLSSEASDPVKQVLTIVEKRVRNLEKRKAKLDSYKNDSSNGKELNEDQKKAVEKYDQVVEVLDFAKEMQKSFNSIVQETAKLQKKAAKREQLERQQHELQRIREIVMIQDILNSMGSEDVRNDFLKGTNGAFQLTEDELNHLDELYKLVCPDRTGESEGNTDFDQLLSAAAEHMQALLDSKQKEVIDTTYKALRETISKISSCGYFNKSEKQEEQEQCETTEPEVNDDATEKSTSDFAIDRFLLQQSSEAQIQPYTGDSLLTQQSNIPVAQSDQSFFQAENTPVYSDKNNPIQEVLSVQGNLNFLQESQIELESSHINPSSMTSRPVSNTVGYPSVMHMSLAQSTPVVGITSQHLPQRPKVENSLAGHITPTSMISSTIASVATQQQPKAIDKSPAVQNMHLQSTNPPADFDPARPIPTQTYTNQSFATAIHPMMAVAAAAGVAVPQNYVPMTLAHGLPTAHILPANVVAQSVQSRGTVSPPATGDPSIAVSGHSTHGGLTATSMSKIINTPLETKEQYVNREFHVPQQQLTADRSSSHTVQSAVNCPSHFESTDVSEETFNNNANNTFGAHNRASRSGTRENRGRAVSNMYNRGTNQTFGNDRGFQSTNNNQAYVSHENTGASSYSSNLKRGLSSRSGGGGGASRGNAAPAAARGVNTSSKGNRAGYRNQ